MKTAELKNNPRSFLRKQKWGLGIQQGKMKKTELIHAIQRTEGYTLCFGIGTENCPYTDCCFRDDCLPSGMAKSIKINSFFAGSII